MVLITFIVIKRKIIFTYKNIGIVSFLTLLFAGYFIFLLNYQGELLNRYFIKDDQFVLLPALLREDALDYRYSNKLDYFYYPFGASVLAYKFFHLNTYYYNLALLITLAIGAILFFKLLHLLNFRKNLGSVLLALLITLFYLVSPNIMESFMYIEHSTATGYIIAVFIASLYLYIKFLNNRSEKLYFILSFLLMLFLLKTSTTRTGFLPIFLIMLEIFYFPQKTKERKSALARITLLFTTFLIMFKPFLLPSSSGKLYGIGFDRFLNGDRIYLSFANIIPIIVPYQIMAWVVKSIKIIALGEFNAPTTNFILNHAIFVWGVVTSILISSVTFILYLKNKFTGKVILLFWFFFLTSLAFFIFFGNVVNENTTHSFNESLKIYAGIFDQSIIVYGATPGSRYYPLPLIFALTAFYLILTSIINWLGQKTKYFMLGFTYLILIFLVWSNADFTQKANHSVNEGIVTVKVITEKVLKMVPDNNEEKVIYSISGRINDIEYIIRGFHGFFKNKAPEYFWQKEELVKYLKENKIKKKNFFAFAFDKRSLMVEDKTSITKKEFQSYLFSNNNTP
ncbi:hypothetical protein HY404_00865 [Candidatus Microgenomates bacterium]|nr:hypothetical protein [Candidatus Microgenomates bacterium]